jgi:hypothetical protein
MFPAMRYYLGTFHGKVVAIGTLFVGTQTVGIYDIVTHNDYRRRGIGSAIDKPPGKNSSFSAKFI